MEPAIAQALDEALSLTEDAVQFGLGLQTKVAELEGKLVGEKVLLEKVAAAEKRASAPTITFDPGLVDQAAQFIVQVGGGEPGDVVKLATTIKGDPNAALQLLIKVAGSVPRLKAINEGGGVKAEKPVEGAGRWV